VHPVETYTVRLANARETNDGAVARETRQSMAPGGRNVLIINILSEISNGTRYERIALGQRDAIRAGSAWQGGLLR
jgi:hypothetical protein